MNDRVATMAHRRTRRTSQVPVTHRSKRPHPQWWWWYCPGPEAGAVRRLRSLLPCPSWWWPPWALRPPEPEHYIYFTHWSNLTAEKLRHNEEETDVVLTCFNAPNSRMKFPVVQQQHLYDYRLLKKTLLISYCCVIQGISIRGPTMVFVAPLYTCMFWLCHAIWWKTVDLISGNTHAFTSRVSIHPSIHPFIY